MLPEVRDIKLLLTSLLAGGWIVMLCQPAPSWSAIGVGLLGIAAAGVLRIVTRWERAKARKAAKSRRPVAPNPLPQQAERPRFDRRQQPSRPGDRNDQPPQRWHRSGGRARRVSAAPGFEPVSP